MRRASRSSDHLAHSFTDLMTSLMVIFILLLVVFVNNQAAVSGTRVTAPAADSQQGSSGAFGYSVGADPNNPGTIAITIPTGALSFLSNRRELGPEGLDFLQTEMPKLAGLLCDDRYRQGIESIVVEGHSDSTRYRGVSIQESQSLNLQLSQDRSMEVVRKTLQYLSERPDDRSCLLEKLSASGRGEQDLQETTEQSRRVVLKVRMNAALVPALAQSLRTELNRCSDTPPPGAVPVAELLKRLSKPGRNESYKITEASINEYFAYALCRRPRFGVDSVHVKLFSGNYVAAAVSVSFDAAERARPGSIPALLRPLLSGKQVIHVDGRFRVASGRLTFTVEKAQLGTQTVPLVLARKIIEVVASQQPERYNTESSMLLPFGLADLRTEPGGLLLTR